MLVVALASPAFVLPPTTVLRPLRHVTPTMSTPDATPDDKKTAPDRYSFEDPRSILSNFFSPKTKKQVGDQTYYTGLSSDGATGVELGRAPAELPEKQMDLVADSCIDWGALTPREVAAAFM